MRLITSLLWFTLSMLHVTAQEGKPEKRKPINTTNINAFIDINYFNPSTLGTNYLSEGANLNGGAGLKAGYFVYDRLYVGGSLNFSSLEVTNPAIIGNGNSAAMSMTHILAGYMLNINDRLSLNADAGYGWIDYRYRLSSLSSADVFADDSGTFVIFNAGLEYRLTKDLGIMTGLAYQINSMNIETAAAIQPLFEKSEFLIFQVGLRFSIR